MDRRTVKIGAVIVAVLLVSLSLGIIIGYYSNNSSKTKETIKYVENPVNQFYESLIQKENSSIGERVLNEINATLIRDHLRIMTRKSHMGGTEGDFDSANYVSTQWTLQGLDYVKMIDYEVLLSYPDPDRPNSFEITNAVGVVNTVKIEEGSFDPELNESYIPRPFLAYSIKGSYTSDKVFYANYGTLEDFMYLKDKVVLNDSIVICRYGKIFRGNKVKLAAEYGAKGVLIYEDPIRGAPTGQTVYPNGEFLPGDGMQRGSLFTGNGDPLTPMYPSTEFSFRLDEKESSELPTIVAQVIGYDHAKMIFEMMQEATEVTNKAEWAGAIQGIKYTYGGKLSDNKKLTVNVYSERQKKKTYNVVGVIKGETEPDRYVMVGNHRDAWVLGAIDPTSGTAAMLEISRVLNSLKKSGAWAPKRTLVFLSWGSEEFGLIGSTEWVEEFQKKLSHNGVAYLNMDIAVQGSFSFVAKSTPLLFDLIFNVTKSVKLTDKETVYDRWLEYAPNKDKTKPAISSTLGSGSDYMGFQQRIGLACVDSTFVQNTKQPQYGLLGSSYATYHSSYETFNLVETFIDPGFKSFKAVASVVAELARRLSDSLILPFNCKQYGIDMEEAFVALKEKYGQTLADKKIELKGLEAAIQNYVNAAKQFHSRLDSVDRTRVNEIRMYNDQLKNLEKSFIDPSGIKRNGFQHMLSAPSLYNSYGGDAFPALADAIFNALQNSNTESWKEVEKQLSIIVYVINSASIVLDQPHEFGRIFS